jgi:hypothetical protein
MAAAHKLEKDFDVTSIPNSTAQGKRLDPAAQRELLIHALRTAESKSRLTTATIEAISVQLRHRQITTEQAVEWIRSEGLEHYLQFGPKGGAQ